MLKLKETWRQILAGIFAAAAFSGAYIGLSLVWWAALAVGVAVYMAALLLVERAPEDNEVFVYANLTQQDINQAVEYCQQTAKALRAAGQSPHIDTNTSLALENMSQLVEEIGKNYQQDPRDLKHSRSFINHYLPKIRTLVQDFVLLSERTITEPSQQRLSQVGDVIRDYVPHVQVIHDACLENDFEKLEHETDVLGRVMKLDNPVKKGD